MLTLLWLVAVLARRARARLRQCLGHRVVTAAIAVALGVAWGAHALPGWLALAADRRVRAARDSAQRAGAAAQARQRRRARRVPQGDAADVADRARGDRGRHRLVGRRALLRPAGLAAAARRRRAPTLTADEQRFLDHEVEELCAMVTDWETTQRPPRPAARASGSSSRTSGFLGHEHREGIRRAGLFRVRALAGDDQAVDALGHGVGDGDGAELARARRAARALRHRRAEAPLPAAPREGARDPVLRAHESRRGLGCGVDSRLRHRLLGRARRQARARPARHLGQALHHARPGRHAARPRVPRLRPRPPRRRQARTSASPAR